MGDRQINPNVREDILEIEGKVNFFHRITSIKSFSYGDETGSGDGIVAHIQNIDAVLRLGEFTDIHTNNIEQQVGKDEWKSVEIRDLREHTLMSVRLTDNQYQKIREALFEVAKHPSVETGSRIQLE